MIGRCGARVAMGLVGIECSAVTGEISALAACMSVSLPMKQVGHEFVPESQALLPCPGAGDTANQKSVMREASRPLREPHPGDYSVNRNFAAGETRSTACRLAVVAALLLASSLSAGLSAGPALAESPLEALRNYQQHEEWESKLDDTMKNLDQIRTHQPTLSPSTVTYIEQAIHQYQQIVSNGGWAEVSTPGRSLKLGSWDGAVVALRHRLVSSGDLSADKISGQRFDGDVDAAVRHFQIRHGLTPDGVVGPVVQSVMNVPAAVRLRQLQTNLVRVRAMSGYLGDTYVMVNIPAAEIEAVDNGVVRSRHTAVVGKIDRQTPILASKIYQLNFNPFWTVPVSIIRKDLIPKMKRDPKYLAKNHIRIYDWHGNELQATDVDWNTDDATKLRFRQDPGADNSLGSVRINFHNKYQVYLHDTPSKSLFTRDYRFDSSGCVRVQNVRDMVTWLLETTTPDWDRARVDSTIASGERVDVTLDNEVPLYLAYVTAWATDKGVVNFREDIYNRDGLNGSEIEGPQIVLQ
ncbi:murein L,D-transpeptidase YcbB/YkuD [Breoghania corrubedonensis]|uniref:Murein L,D-transpeptidase YcbB/YkuD n=1 Tax=Breoghania corrubedonensis TaxID=665038 RepID=A0A2T5VC26_9HYPH|nr:murein L,D-transpeptidase YcbB/YkuD [Breoghania corrubedonensis]